MHKDIFNQNQLIPLVIEQYSKKKIANLLKKLHGIMEEKAALDMHNEIGNGKTGYSDKQEKELMAFDIKKFITKNVK